jgi:phage-related protein
MNDDKVFATRFYRTPSGDEPVRDFLRALPRDARAKCGRYMQQLEWRGLTLSAALAKKLAGDIWELRPEYDGIEYRLYFGITAGQAVYVHAVVKK